MDIQNCSKCRVSFRRQAILATLADAGCRSSVDPCECPEGGDHGFQLSQSTQEASSGLHKD